MSAVGHIVVHIDHMRAANMSQAGVHSWLEHCAAELRDSLHACETAPSRTDVEGSLRHAFGDDRRSGVTP